jgi:hypothetical protein
LLLFFLLGIDTLRFSDWRDPAHPPPLQSSASAFEYNESSILQVLDFYLEERISLLSCIASLFRIACDETNAYYDVCLAVVRKLIDEKLPQNIWAQYKAAQKGAINAQPALYAGKWANHWVLEQAVRIPFLSPTVSGLPSPLPPPLPLHTHTMPTIRSWFILVQTLLEVLFLIYYQEAQPDAKLLVDAINTFQSNSFNQKVSFSEKSTHIYIFFWSLFAVDAFCGVLI